jgi:hypothetical protein
MESDNVVSHVILSTKHTYTVLYAEQLSQKIFKSLLRRIHT